MPVLQNLVAAASALCLTVFLSPAAVLAQPAEVEKTESSLRIRLPAVAQRGVPVPSVLIEVVDADGIRDRRVDGSVQIDGLRLEPPEAFRLEMQSGLLLLETDLARGQRVVIDGEAVRAKIGPLEATRAVRSIPGWLSLLPPLVAIVLAVWVRNVYVALLAAVYAGVVVIEVNPWTAFLRVVDTYLVNEFVELPDGGDHIRIMLFTIFLGATIGVMSASGGTLALVNSLTRFATSRERGQVLTWLLGLIVFFDDYANTLLVGSTMRSVSERLRISREKLAFLVDSTAAPVAGLAIVSTWVGFELGQIEEALNAVNLQEVDAYRVFLETIPYRIYPILLLAFVGLIAWSGRDYGPMLRAESRDFDLQQGLDASLAQSPEEAADPPMLMRNALVPLIVLLLGIATGLLVVSNDSVWVLLVSAFGASLVSILVAVGSRSLALHSAVDAWINGARGMFVGVSVLILAWTIATICDDQHLGTAAYIVDRLGTQLRPEYLPCLSFLVAAAVSFATGSSYATMGLLIPLFVSITHYILQVEATEFVASGVFLGTVGAVLAGAIFGDHCSPISDTTVLSSMATDCDHLQHVGTQMPYAVTVGGISAVLGYIPIGFGWSPWLCLLLSLGVLSLVVRVFGRRPELAEVSLDAGQQRAGNAGADR